MEQSSKGLGAQGNQDKLTRNTAFHCPGLSLLLGLSLKREAGYGFSLSIIQLSTCLLGGAGGRGEGYLRFSSTLGFTCGFGEGQEVLLSLSLSGIC